MKEQLKLMETENRLLKSNIATMRREQQAKDQQSENTAKALATVEKQLVL
jgi:hypothetical protein